MWRFTDLATRGGYWDATCWDFSELWLGAVRLSPLVVLLLLSQLILTVIYNKANS